MRTIRKWIGFTMGMAAVLLLVVGFAPDSSNFNNTQFLVTGTTMSIAHLSANLVDSGALNIAQMPSLAANTVLGIGAGGGTPVALTMGANMSIVAGALTASASGGGTNYWQTNSGYVFPVPLLSGLGVSNNLGFFNAGGDVSKNATNYANLTTNRPALYVDRSNVLSGVLTFPSSSNSVTMFPGGADWLLVSATPVNFTNAVGATSGYLYSADVTVSNSTAAAFTNRFDPTWTARGYSATNANSTLGIRAAVVPASGELFVHVETRGVNETNYWISY